MIKTILRLSSLIAIGLLIGTARPASAQGDFLSVTAVVSDNGLAARKVQWIDSASQTRTAIMVDQRPAGAGYPRQLTYKVNGADRVCTGTGADGHMGDGYVQNHTATGGDNSSHTTPGTTTVVLAGTHHAIISYDMPTYQIDGNTVPTTIQWFFADGRSHPIFALSQDARATAGNLGADTRSPYGDVAYDGGAGATVGGASYGDTYKFATLAAAPEQVTRASGWRYDEPNSIPYAMQWTDPAQVDAEMGHVATVPISVQDQGSDPRTTPTVDNRGKQQLKGPMIDDENWSYQVLNYVLPANGPTGSKRLTWGSNWGRPGGFDNYGAKDAQNNPLNQREYSQHSTDPLGQAYGGTRADGMLTAYSVFVVLGTHSGGYKGGTVGQMVSQVENAARATLSAAVGTVKLTGGAGVGNASSASVTYVPAGYNAIYSTWEIVANANANAVDATLTPAAGTSLDHPLFVVNGYTLGQMPTISVGAGLATPDVDYFATLDAANQRLWITVNRSVGAPVNLVVSPGGGAPQPPVINAIPANGVVGSSITIMGQNFSGANKVTFNGTSANFTVDSATQITAVVPAGATVGLIAVTTPGGTATSATNFTPLAPPQPPVITAIPANGAVGSSVTIMGQNFSGANKVTFNGTSANFTVDSATQITAIVPAGATAGPIAVTTPGGTATSATNFTPAVAPPGGVIAGTFQQMHTDDGGWFTGLAAHSSGRLYGRTDVGGLYRSDDHGDSWTYLSGDMTSYTAHCVQGVAISSGDANVVYQCLGFSSGNSDQGVWKSTDGGTTWTQVKSGIHFSGNDPERWGGECIAIRSGNDSEVWAGSRGDGLWRSTDAGATWTQLGAAIFAGAQFTSISLPPAGRSDIFVGASGFSGPGGVWVSADEGATWQLITAGAPPALSAPTKCWRIIRGPNGKVLVAGAAGALGSALLEFNAGNWSMPGTYTWNDISWPGIDRAQEIPLAAALADGRIVAGSIFGGYNGGPDSLRTQIRSLAGTWSPTDALNGIMPAWQRTPPPTLIEGSRNALVQDPTDANRWFIAGGYSPFRTTDGGASWQYIVNGIDEVLDYKVNFHPTDSSRIYLPMADHGGAVVLDGGDSGSVSRYITTRTLPYPDDLGLCHAILASGDRLLALGGDERSNWRARIFKSTDNGVTWSVLVQAGLPNQDNRTIISAVASHDLADDILVAVAGSDDGANGGVYRSLNAGDAFVRATGLPAGADYGDQFNPNAVLAADATDNNARYLFLKNYGLFMSADRGASWTLLNTGLPNYGVVAADASLSAHLWVGTCCNQPIGLSRSTDGGAHWATIAGFNSVTDVDAANDRVAVLGQRTGDTYDRVYYSGDGGVTWGEITRPGHRFGNASAVAVDPWRPGTVWISTNGRSLARFTPGILTPPIINTIPASGAVGTPIIITGANFSTATAVTFNGTSATFTIDSATQITAVVPAGATAGPIAVITPAGTATSATNFAPLSAPQPPMLTLKAGPGSAGLKIVSGPGQYDRQNIATDTTANDYGWIGSAGPVTYSLTISQFPPLAYLGFQAHVFLVPNSTGSTAPDFDDPSVVMLDVQAHADGTATAWLRYKINKPADNSFLYGAGTLGQVDCATGPLGVWSLTFPTSIAITLTAPNGKTTQLSFPDPAAIQPAFGNRITAYFGNQANDPSQVGQSSTFGRIQISGTPRAAAIDDTFPGPDLNQHPASVSWQWVKLGGTPAGISIASTQGFMLSWNLPDTGFTLQSSPSLSAPAWTALSLANSVVGSTKTLFIPQWVLPGNPSGFFRLVKLRVP